MTSYAVTTRGRIRWWIPTSGWWGKVPRELIDSILDDPDGALGSPLSVARPRTGRKRFYRLARSASDPGIFVKVFATPRGPARALTILRASKARHEARVAAAVRARGFAAAVPIAVGEERRAGVLIRSFSIILEIDAVDLRATLTDPRLAPKRRRELILSFGALNRRLHDAGVDQDDTSPNNFLVDAVGDWTLIDFERCRVGPPLGDRRWLLLAKLHRHDLGVKRSDRLRFLRSYLGSRGSDPAQRRRAWQRVASALRRVRRHDARRAARAAFQPGRHIQRIAGSWIVRGRESAPTLKISSSLGETDARSLWVLAHQLERLRLPALRPVRLTGHIVELERLPVAPPGEQNELTHLIARTRRAFEECGRFVAPPEWILTSSGPVLKDPRTFQLFW